MITDDEATRAFPLFVKGQGYNEGLTKRELFAAMAMQGLLSGQEPRIKTESVLVGDVFTSSNLASASVEIADKLIAELEKK